jgi:hypothetical protein
LNLQDHPWVDAGFHDGVAEYLKETAEELVAGDATGLAKSYALAFMANVNWQYGTQNLLNQSGGLGVAQDLG